MKKTLAIFLVLVTLLSATLVACKKKTPAAVASGDEGEGDNNYVGQQQNVVTSDTKDTSGTGNDTTVWTERAGTVYVMGNSVRIRSQANTNSNSIITSNTKIGDSFSFTAVNSKWYKITYNNAEAYISADYVTENAADADFTTKKLATPTNLEIEEAPANWDKEGKGYSVVLRANASLTENGDDKYIYKADVTADKPLKKIAENASGNIWQVEYDGEIYYMGPGSFKYCDGNPNNGGSTGGQG